MNREEFLQWLGEQKVSRAIKIIQNHHTYLPDYKSFTGKNHFEMCESMERYHVKEAGYAQIAQNITTFPDGMIMICRPFDVAPAGIKGANANGICIENIGNFDLGKDQMTPEHRKTILFINASLCKKFNLPVNSNSIVYHHWYDLNTGTRNDGVGGVTKSCPGTAWFGGNSITAANNYFFPEVKKVVL